jgi:MinD-like ATPase involved in chromosome partitioning or flagellar assembly
MITFDQILPTISEVLNSHSEVVAQFDWMLINRDLNGRVRLILPESVEATPTLHDQAKDLYRKLAVRITPHAYPVETGILYESSREKVCDGATHYLLEGCGNVWVIDRLATEGNWAQIAPEAQGVTRVVFFSIKGGVGRSTALAATAWTLAQAGKRVLVLDLDLESPGLSSSLLPPDRQPVYGITEWLVEDLVNNSAMVLDSMVATSSLSYDGEIYVVPAHGQDPGEYIAKLGRVWMPKVKDDGEREPWSARLERLLGELEARIQPDVVLIDSRAGIDEVASSCVTDLGAKLVLLFALEGNQTWTGYDILFKHWNRAQVAQKIRERLKIVAALVPDTGQKVSYIEDLREDAYKVFTNSLYDEIAPSTDTAGPTQDGKWRVGELVEGWNFDEADETAPHSPWPVYWHSGWVSLRSLHGRLVSVDAEEVNRIFGSLLQGVSATLVKENSHD